MQPININWSFEEAVVGAFDSYIGYGIESKGRRNSYLKAWGSAVGREQAVQGLDNFIRRRGSIEQAAADMEVAVSTLQRLRKYFLELPSNQRPQLSELDIVMERHQLLMLEEDRQCEFKEVVARNPVDSIRNTSDEYAVAFLNSEGGRIFWGVRDNRTVVGIVLDDRQRDEIRRGVTSKLDAIRPNIDVASTRIVFHPVYENGAVLSNT